MPTSRSPKPGAKPAAPPRPRLALPLAAVALLSVAVVVVATLPASTVQRLLPAAIGAGDFSGTVWHGSAGRITLDGRDAGALEWRLHPLALLRLAASADLHWVKAGFVADAQADLARGGVTLQHVDGDGPIEDLVGLGVPPGWHGTVRCKIHSLRAVFVAGGAVLKSVSGDVSVATLSSSQVAAGADLGGYVLHLAEGAILPDGDASAELRDTGGPLELTAVIHFSAAQHTGMLSGTAKSSEARERLRVWPAS